MTTTFVFVVWLLLPTSPDPVPVFGHGASLAQCEQQLMAQLQGESVIVAASKCVQIGSWVYFRAPEPATPPVPRPLRRQRVPVP